MASLSVCVCTSMCIVWPVRPCWCYDYYSMCTSALVTQWYIHTHIHKRRRSYSFCARTQTFYFDVVLNHPIRYLLFAVTTSTSLSFQSPYTEYKRVSVAAYIVETSWTLLYTFFRVSKYSLCLSLRVCVFRV